MTRVRRGLFFAVTAWLVACSSGDGGDGRGYRGGESGLVAECVVTLYACPDAGGPSYMNDVAAILNARCNGCHGKGGEGVTKGDFTTLPQVRSQRQAIHDQAAACQMPPPPLAPLTTAERAAIFTWIACGALSN